MGLFWKRKKPEDYFASGQEKLKRQDYAAAALDFVKVSGKGNVEADYYAGYTYFMWDQSHPDRLKRELAKKYLQLAAEEGSTEAASLLAEHFGVGNSTPPRPVPQLKTPLPRLRRRLLM